MPDPLTEAARYLRGGPEALDPGDLEVWADAIEQLGARLDAYETLRDACEDSPDYLDPDISAALAALRRRDRGKP